MSRVRDWTLQYSMIWAAADGNSPTECVCPDGYVSNGDECVKISTLPTEQPPTFTALELLSKTYNQYSQLGIKIFEEGFNANGTGAYTLYTFSSTDFFWHNFNSSAAQGVMNRAGLWTEPATEYQQIGFSKCFNASTENTYLIGFGVDNFVTVRIDGVPVIEMFPTEDANTFRYWHVYPVKIKKGVHVIEIIANNMSQIACVGAEIYGCTPAELMATKNETDLAPYLIFSTKDMIGQYTNLGTNGYPIMADYALVFCDGNPPYYRKLEYVNCGETPSDPVYEDCQCALLTGYPIAMKSSNFGASWGAIFYSTTNSYVSGALSTNAKYQAFLHNPSNLYVSSDYGKTWSAKVGARAWQQVAISASGQYQTAVAYNNYIYVSSNYGQNWAQQTNRKNWYWVAMDLTGQYQTAVAYNQDMYVSDDYGQTWTAKSMVKPYYSVAMSGDGQYRTAAPYALQLFVSSDYGVTWGAKDSARNWQVVAMDLTGQYQVAAGNNTYLYVSSDYGQTWSQRAVLGNWASIAVCTTGQKMIAVGRTKFYTSVDYGQTWTSQPTLTNWSGIAFNRGN